MPEISSVTSVGLLPVYFALFVGAAVGLALALGSAREWRVRAARRWRATLQTYADREIQRAKARRLAQLERVLTQRRPVADRPGPRDVQPRLTQGGKVVLILSRRTGEQIVIPQFGVMVRVVAVKGNSVRLAITAPPEVGVWREEIWVRERQPATCCEQTGGSEANEE
jgi:carbon storage regulator